MKTVSIISLVAVLIALGTAVGAEQTVKLGMIYPQSGQYSVYGPDEWRAAMIAVEEINADGGILDKKIELIARDSRSRADISANSMIELVRKEKVKMIIGGVSGEANGVVADLCQRSSVVFMAPISFANADGGKKTHRYSFNGGFNPWMAAQTTAGYLSKHFSGKRLCYLVTDCTWGWTIETYLREFTDTQDEIVHKRFLVRPDISEQELKNVLQNAQASKPDALILVQLGADMISSLKMISSKGMKEQMQVVAPVVTLNIAEAAGAKVMEGIIGCTDWTWRVPYQYDHGDGVSFVEKFSSRYNRYPSSSAANVYTCLMEYQTAVQQAGSFETPRVIEALEGRRFSWLKDEQQWRNWDHQSVQSVYIVQGKPQIEVLKDGYGLDFFEILERVSGPSIVETREEWNQRRERAGLSINLEPLQVLAEQ